MGFNKSKHVENAQKLLNQGKIAQAIAEYQHILKYETKDQVTLMTVGELYIRQGETYQAIDYFERLAQIFVGDGFLTKAIAVYKRIAKLAPEEIRPMERLAELYVQQGVMSEARPLYLQLAETHLKSNRQGEAIELLKKLLAADPDNMRIQIRLADLYQAMGRTKEAVEAYVESSQRAVARGDQAEAVKLAERALKLDPKNAAAITVKARAHAADGSVGQAAQLLQHVTDINKGGEQAELLLDLYTKNEKWKEAEDLALRVFDSDEKNFGLVQKLAETLTESDQAERAAKIIDRIRVPLLDAGEYEAVAQLLSNLATRLPGRIEPLEWLVDTCRRTSDSFRLPDALAKLGDALVAAKKFDRAKEVLEQLLERQPDNDSARHKLNDVTRKLGQPAPEEPALEVPEEVLPTELAKPPAPKVRPAADVSVEVPTVKAAAPSSDAALDEETQRFISQSLTDVDLFASYGLAQKAVSLLDAVLRRAPQHTPTLEKLLDFSLGAGDDRRTAQLAAQLEHIHRERGDERGAERFGELRRRFQRAAGLADEELAPPTPPAAVPTVEAKPEVKKETKAAASEPGVAKAPPPPAPAVHEVDLSDEWSALLEQTPPAKPEARPAAAAPIEEFAVDNTAEPHAHAEFTVSPEEAHVELAGDAQDGAPSFAEISAEIPETAKAEPEFELAQDYELVLEPEPLEPTHEQPGAVSAPPPPPPKPKAAPPPPPPKPKAAPPPAPAPKATPPREAPQPAFASDQFLAELAKEIDQLGIEQPSPEFSKQAPPPATKLPALAAKKVPSTIENEPLREVFEEFRAELGEMGAEDEDLETHYNLGIAFREMGLLEEAISEFQKVAQANDKGRAFRYAMQCCTLLGLAFMEKGQPAIAALWYERALQMPGIDPESALALRYDLGVAQESAGELEAALKSFSRVYAINIDYRDVAERIAALEKTAR